MTVKISPDGAIKLREASRRTGLTPSQVIDLVCRSLHRLQAVDLIPGPLADPGPDDTEPSTAP